jgi:type IX secretion system PorP/SprF family membrane protein
MKRLLLISIIILSISNLINAQQIPLFSQYMMNDLFINPAVSGSKDYSPLQLSIHKQWVGIEGSPASQTVSFHTLLPNNHMGVGVALFNEVFGSESNFGFHANYAYHFNVDKYNRISLGLSAVLMRYGVDLRRATLTQPGDPAVPNDIEKTILPNANFGVYAYGEKYFGGFSIMNLFHVPLKINKNTDENFVVRHYFLMGGYTFELPNDIWEVEPTLLMKMTGKTRPQLDFGARMYYDKDFWFGISFRPNDAFIANIGFKYKQYYASYAYDFTVSKLSRHSMGSQEIIFGMNIGENIRRRRTFY